MTSAGLVIMVGIERAVRVTTAAAVRLAAAQSGLPNREHGPKFMALLATTSAQFAAASTTLPAPSVVPHPPGLLVSWAAVPDASHYVVLRARAPSLSFFAIDDASCCPRRPDGELPCCPVAETSLQVEDVEPGRAYRFRIHAVGAGGAVNVSAASAAVAAAAVPAAPPGAPTTTANRSAAVFDVAWAAPPADGGDAVRGYRLEANHTASGVRAASPAAEVLVANTTRNATAVAELALLPSTRYWLSVRALNRVGAGPPSAALDLTTEEAPAARHELALGLWARGSVQRGGARHHRVFVPSASEEVGFHVQQASGAAGAALLHVYVQRGQPPELTYPGYEPCDHPAYRVVRAADEYGGLRATFARPDEGWWYVLVDAAGATDAAVAYDVRVAVARAGAPAVAAAMGGDAERRYDALAPRWRYYNDPDGASAFSPWVLNSLVAPLHAPPLPADAAANQIAPNGYAGRPDGCIMGKTGPEWLNPFDENAHVEPGRHCVALADEFDAQVASGVSPADAAAAVDPPEDFDAYTDEPWGEFVPVSTGNPN